MAAGIERREQATGNYNSCVLYSLVPTPAPVMLQYSHACQTIRHQLSRPPEFGVAKDPVIVACNLPCHRLKHPRH